jgi:aspartate aminotransferase
LIDSGDEVIYPNPGYPIYESLINYVGGKAVPLPLLEEKEFSFDINDLKKAVTDKTRMIIINSPQNPTGGILKKEDLKAIAKIAIENDIWVMSDEIYSRIFYEGEFNSIISIDGMKERTILVDGFSKVFAMTGWRLGYGIMPKELIPYMVALNTNIITCTATFTQYAGIEGLEGPQDDTYRMVEEFKARRDIIVDGLNDIKGLSACPQRELFMYFPMSHKPAETWG